MRNLKRILICGGLFCLTASAQSSSGGVVDVKIPVTHTVQGVGNVPATTLAPAANACEAAVRAGIYRNCREGAVAALRAGNDAASLVPPKRERAVSFYLLSVDRDPSYSRALFNLGVMSVRSNPENWDDALKFYREAAVVEPNPGLSSVLAKEITRVEAIARLESTPEGHKQRQFDLALNALIGRMNDPAVAVVQAAKLVASDPGRWEGPAAAGILHAALTHYTESAASLEAAVKLAPSEMRTKLSSAAELAKNEAQYVKALQEGDNAFEKKDYENAGRLYADAWQASPGRVSTGMKSAVAFLMADRVSLAVQILARVHQLKDPDLSQKAGLMLKELAAVSPDAKTAADADISGEVPPVFDVADRIKALIGDLRNDEIRLVTGPGPAPMGDDLEFPRISDDELNRPKEEYVLSTESLFNIYLKRVGDRRVQPQEGSATAGTEPASQQPGEPAPVAPSALRPPSLGTGPAPVAPPMPPKQ